MLYFRKIYLFGILFFTPFVLSHGAIQYTIADLGTLGGASSWASSINSSGLIVGDSYIDNGFSGVFPVQWQNGVISEYTTITGGISYQVLSVNDYGQAVGNYMDSHGDFHAVLYNGINETIILDGTLAADINNSGQVILHTNSYSTVIWQNGTITTSPISEYVLNNNGQIGGVIYTGENLSVAHAAIYDLATHSIKDYGILSENDSIVSVYGINDLGHVVGTGMHFNGAYYAFYCDEAHGMINLTHDSNYCWANSINDLDQIVGVVDDQGVLWDKDNRYYLSDLLTVNPGWTELSPNDINNLGQIVGTGVIDGQHHAFLMTPIPEPGMVAMLLLGGLAVFRRRARKLSVVC